MKHSHYIISVFCSFDSSSLAKRNQHADLDYVQRGRYEFLRLSFLSCPASLLTRLSIQPWMVSSQRVPEELWGVSHILICQDTLLLLSTQSLQKEPSQPQWVPTAAQVRALCGPSVLFILGYPSQNKINTMESAPIGFQLRLSVNKPFVIQICAITNPFFFSVEEDSVSQLQE